MEYEETTQTDVSAVQTEVETKAKEILALLETEVSRESSLAKTKVQEAVMWVKEHFNNKPATPLVAADSTGSSDTATPAEPTAA